MDRSGNPFVKGNDKIHLDGDQYRKLKNPQTTGEAKLSLDADYNGTLA